MVTVIAESKTMGNRLMDVPEEVYLNNKPFYENEADQLMGYLMSLSLEDIALRLKISFSLAIKAFNLANEFPNKKQGNVAIGEYTGEVFKALDYESLDDCTKQYSRNHLLIISSLYGVLRTDNIIRPYRFDFNNDCTPADKSVISFWKAKNTSYLIQFLKQNQEHEIINLLPMDASKCIDWKTVKQFAKIETPNFKIITDNALLKTPNTGYLKQLRGLFLRHLLVNRINDIETLYSISTMNFGVDSEHSQPGAPLVLCNG